MAAFLLTVLLSLVFQVSTFKAPLAARSFGTVKAPSVARARSSPTATMGMSYVELRKVLIPADNDNSERNAFGLQPLIWGACTLTAPVTCTKFFFGLTPSGWVLTLTRALAMLHMLVGASICRNADRDMTLATSFVLFGGWAMLLKGAINAGTVGIVAWNGFIWCCLCALAAAARLGVTASGAVFTTSWAALLLGPLFVKPMALPMISASFFASKGAGGAAAKPTPKAAAKPKAAAAKPKPAAKPAAKPATPKPPATPAPAGYKYDPWGRLVIA